MTAALRRGIYNGLHWSKPEHVADSSGLVAVPCLSAGLCFAIDVQSNEVFR
jgi:hypothetical protein